MDKEKISALHREAILEAADQLFQEFGKEGTRINMIAKLADYSTATIYVYFKNKEEIFSCMIYKCMERIRNMFLAIAEADESFEEKFYSICNALVAFQDESPLYFEGMIGHINMNFEQQETPEIYREIFELGNEINKILEKMIDAGISQNALHEEIDKTKLIFYLWGSLTGIVRMAKQKGDYFMLNNVTRKSLLEFSFKNIFNGIQNIGG